MHSRGPAGVALVTLLILLGAAPSPSSGDDSWSDPFPGVRRLRRTTSNQHINVLIVDLCAAGVSLRATGYSERGRTASSFGALVGAQAVVNGDFFGAGYTTDGIAMHAGAAWGGSDHGYVAPIAIGSKRIDISHHNNTLGVAAWTREVVSGHPTLLDDGTTVGNPGDPLCTNRHPRTAIGVNSDHTKLILAVVDGRASTRIGMTCPELAGLMREFGAFDAVNMDGGGSSTMWLGGIGVVNYPSDGSSRVVGNHLAVYARGSGAAEHCPCTAHCEGSVIHGDDCGAGDCAAYGSTCVDDDLGVRCVFVFCPAVGEDEVCIDETTLGACTDGAVAAESCPDGEVCSDDGTSAACGEPGSEPPDSDGPDGDGGGESPANDDSDLDGGCRLIAGREPGLSGAAWLLVAAVVVVVRRRRRRPSA